MATNQRLISYSIETDHEVLVTFEDGSSRRLHKNELRGALQPDDYSRLSRAFRMRQSFWRRNLPGSMGMGLATAAAVAAIVASSDRPLLHLAPHQAGPAYEPVTDLQAAREIPTPHPSPTPVPSGSAAPPAAEAESSAAALHSHRQTSPGILRRLGGFIGQMLR